MASDESPVEAGAAPPRTFGELRKRLEQLGNPWGPGGWHADDEPLPIFPTGGDRLGLADIEAIGSDLSSYLQMLPPTNPAVREVWATRGTLVEEAIPTSCDKSAGDRGSG
jgi:hypothetical protein